MPVKPYARDREWLLPANLGDMVPANPLVRFLADIVDGLDLRKAELRQETSARGEPEYHVRMMLAAWLYAYMSGVTSSRKLEVLTYENIPVMWLLGGQKPDHSTLARFRQKNQDRIVAVFKETARAAVKQGLVDFELQAIDGTRVGSVSRDRALRRKELRALDAAVARVINDMEKGIVADELGGQWPSRRQKAPKNLRDAQKLRDQVKTAISELDRREEERRGGGKGAVDAETNERLGPPVNLADPEAVLMKGRRGYMVGYNAQVIVGADIVAAATDNDQMVPMLEAIEETTGRLADVTVLDGGYHSAKNLEATQDTETDLYVADPAMGRKESKGQRRSYHKDAFEYQEADDTYVCPHGHTLTLEHVQKAKKRGQNDVRIYRCHDCDDCPHKDDCTREHRGRSIHVRPQDKLLRRHRAKMRGERAKV